MKYIANKICSALVVFGSLSCQLYAAPNGSENSPLRVVLIPADGGTEEGTIADFKPVFHAITKAHGIHFDLKVGQSYGAVVEAMSHKLADIAWFGPVSYMEAYNRGGAELLAVASKKGSAVYYSGIFVPVDSNINTLADLKGKKMAFGDTSSTSSFNYPVAMLLSDGIDPVKDLGSIYLTGSHANSVSFLASGKVDACACAFPSFNKAIKAGVIDPKKFKPLVKSEAIPNPPLAMHPELPDSLKEQLRDAFRTLHTNPHIRPDQIRGYGGKVYEKYDVTIQQKVMDDAVAKLSKVTKELKSEMLKKAAQ